MNKLIEVIEEAKKRMGCTVIEDGNLYRIRGYEYALSEFIGWIETDGYTVYSHEEAKMEEDSLLFSCLIEIVSDNV